MARDTVSVSARIQARGVTAVARDTIRVSGRAGRCQVTVGAKALLNGCEVTLGGQCQATVGARALLNGWEVPLGGSVEFKLRVEFYLFTINVVLGVRLRGSPYMVKVRVRVVEYHVG